MRPAGEWQRWRADQIVSTVLSVVENPFGRNLARYADCIVSAGVAVSHGDKVDVVSAVDHRVLAVALAEAGYRAGAAVVDVRYADPRVQAARIRYGDEASLGELPPGATARYRALLRPDAATIATIGESDPGVFDGLDPSLVALEMQRPAQRLHWLVKAMLNGHVRWNGCAWPTPHWAAQAFPDLEESKAQRRLASDLLEFCRLGPEDPPGHAGWDAHATALRRRAKKLSQLGATRVHLQGPATSLEIGLSPGTVWIGGGQTIRGRDVCANIPTEEVFTSPTAGVAEGTFRCSMPLSFQGRVIEDIGGEFRSGRLVRLSCKREADRKFLAAFLDSEPNARRLGEVALVDATSRIGAKRRLYYNTLLDENAAVHIAFGAGFGITRQSGQNRGVNRAQFHLDVMLGTPDFNVTATVAKGRTRPLIADGHWQI
jgi:aminopeptidase